MTDKHFEHYGKFDWEVFRDVYWEILWKITKNPKYLNKLMGVK